MRHALFQVPYPLPSSVSSKSFACHSYENCRGVPQLFPLWNSPSKDPSPFLSPQLSIRLRPVPLSLVPLSPIHYPFSFHTLAHSFALTKNSTPLFPSNCALFAKNHPGWGYAPLSPKLKTSTMAANMSPSRRLPAAFLHEPRIARTPVTLPTVAAFPSGCYDLVLHDPC